MKQIQLTVDDVRNRFNMKMYQTHVGLSKDYKVSCPELDYLNEIARECGVTGSRMMGGGFGGCTINLVKDNLYDTFIATAKEKYQKAYGKEPLVIVGRRPGDVPAVWADVQLANEELGWKAERTLEETLAAAWKWEKRVRGIK